MQYNIIYVYISFEEMNEYGTAFKWEGGREIWIVNDELKTFKKSS